MRFLLSIIFVQILYIITCCVATAEDGYDLWLRYNKITDQQLLEHYKSAVHRIELKGSGPAVQIVKEELENGMKGLLGQIVPVNVSSGSSKNDTLQNGTIVFAIIDENGIPFSDNLGGGFPEIREKSAKLKDEGFLMKSIEIQGNNILLIFAKSEAGILYSAFHFLKLIQTHQNITDLSVLENPKTDYRLLNHWDNPDRTVERGYAGFSIWEWHKLPGYVSPRYKDYARANASVGINGTVLTNVNANARVLTPQYLGKIAAIADVLRPYAIKVYLTARFSAPVELGGLKTADPLNKEVRNWWKTKIDEIYKYVPDFGGFLVKANSEGQPGPQNYERSHAEGANMLAEALDNHGGIVMWRAFVYSFDENEDRAKQAYNEFKPLDGKFRDNVMVQVKNGPIDFQPREPFHPLFGAMPKTPLMMEFQITQEYLGFATHLVYLASMWKECLESDTYAKGEGSTVATVIDGSLYNKNISGMAGVSNIGADRNWTGHPFAQSNWYALGRLAWDHTLTEAEIADEWLRMTFSNNKDFIAPVKEIMLFSREASVNYMTPLGLHHIMGEGHHYGPGPWVDQAAREDWTSVYYHRADENGIGFDRTKTGSNAVSQYYKPVEEKFGDPGSCPEKFLLWFHHPDWDYTMNSGRTLWEELCHKYYKGVSMVRDMQEKWNAAEGLIDRERFVHVKSLLAIQLEEAEMWRNACLLYFQQFSGRPIPKQYEKPSGSLEFYKKLDFRYAPGNLHCE